MAFFVIDSGAASFAGQSQKSIGFAKVHEDVPIVTLVAETGTEGVNAFVISVTTSGVEIGTGAPFSGIVHYRAMSEVDE